MDFKGWKKVKEDEKSCTLEHPKGHRMTVALKALPRLQQEQVKRLKLADGGEVDSSDASDGPTHAGNHTPITINVGTPNQPTQAPQNMSVGKATPPPPVQRAPAQAPPQQSSDMLYPDQTLNAPAAIRLQQKAIDEQVPIDAAKAKDIQAAEEERLQGERDYQARVKGQVQDFKNHTDAFADYMTKNPINANAYLENMGTGKKVATGIGLFLGGWGTAYGGHNYAMDFLNKQIDRDIDAQKQRSEQQRTVWGAYKQLYDDNVVADNLTKISMNDILVHQTQLAAAKQGTAQAQQAADALKAQKLIENNQLLIDTAGRRGTMGSGGAGHGQGHQAPQGMPTQGRSDRILSPNAESKYNWAMSKFNTVQSDKQKDEIKDEYLNAKQVDEALDQIDKLYPQLQGKTTYGGYLADKIDPKMIGGALGAGVEALGAAGAIPTGGASLVGALPAAIGAGAAGVAGGAAVKQGLRAIGGQTQTQYETAANSLKTIIGAGLKGSGLTPSEIGEIAEEFKPTKMDSAESAKDKLEKLKAKIISVAKKGQLKASRMTNN